MSKTNAVQVEISGQGEQELTFEMPPAALREQAAARLAAHRERRMRTLARPAEAPVSSIRSRVPGAGGADARSERIAHAVAERYAQTQSYRAFLAAEAESSVRLAQAAAEVAARNAEAMVVARRVLLVELEEMTAAEVQPESRLEVVAPVRAPAAKKQRELAPEMPRAKSTTGGLTVRLYEDSGRTAAEAAEQAAAMARHAAEALKAQRRDTPKAERSGTSEDETRMLDDEIAYRQSPMDELERPSVAIPGNLLEFPRQLVAARKARPRYAEGPLRDDAESQLRIFEVEAVHTEAPAESSAPEWSSIWLDALAQTAPELSTDVAEYPIAQRPATAAISLRMMAAAVDGCLIGAAYGLFATVFVYQAEVLPGIGMSAAVSAALLLVLYLSYQMLFYTFSDGTPGMRYAHIGLCTLSDENPTRPAMRRRIFAVLLAACPLGLGLIWACLDDDRLGWHDRISRMYLRSY